MKKELMRCWGGCGRTLIWPDNFPNYIYAICHSCAEQEKLRMEKEARAFRLFVVLCGVAFLFITGGILLFA